MDHAGPVILIVDDDPVAVELIRVSLMSQGFENIEFCTDSRLAMETVRTRPISVVLLDLFMPEVSGFDILQLIVQELPGLPVIVLTVDDSVDAAVKCMRIGAFDFMTKPVDRNRLGSSVNNALRLRELEERLSLFGSEPGVVDGPRRPDLFREIITRSPRMEAIFQYVEAIAPSPKAVLITGESGTGKELLARAIHDASERRGPFVPVNVAGLDDVMFSDTLFGHVRGAFTGADRPRSGLVEKAGNGTLFLDEIGDLEMSSQVKLLRLLQEGEYYPLGSDEPKRVTLRVLAATNADLIKKQENGTFRRDLYYRLMSHLIRVPPLRERGEDLDLLARHFARDTAQAMGRPVPQLSDEFARLLKMYPFPGNIRELQAIISDAVSQARDGIVPTGLIEDYFAAHGGVSSADAASDKRIHWTGDFPTLGEAEEFLVSEALRRCDNNQTAAAKMLGVAQSTLSRRLKKHSD